MTGGGDLDEIEDVDLTSSGDDSVPDTDGTDGSPLGIEPQADAEGLAGVPLRAPAFALSANDPDRTAGASDIGGIAGGIDDR